jgi:hypothetical protein
MNYEKQANEFAQKHNVKLSMLSVEYKPYFNESICRYVFTLRLFAGRKQYTFTFGQSLMKQSEEPTMYDVLACLQKYDVGSFEDFCYGFGYNEDSKHAERTYKAVCKEYAAVRRLFTQEQIEELTEIN